jgi:hypothetical protein
VFWFRPAKQEIDLLIQVAKLANWKLDSILKINLYSRALEADFLFIGS